LIRGQRRQLSPLTKRGSAPKIGDNEQVERTINVPDDLLARIESTVAQQGKSVDQWIEEALRAQLEDRAWQDLLAYGREKGLASGYSEEDVPRVVKEWRREHRAR
jgi:hypothetical protein